ncbi:40S ribosomal protein S3-1 [Acorus calamus]|uniref:40S ribosomal protein S3-1 n=1 Tax=Acorus calamus TaxID=4465 RepID=A0AAV9DPN1_ACOCL|nr:40S ribosomal protein S3-1 [Acorus calamus]
MATQMSKKRKFVADGVLFAELNEVLTRELAEDGWSAGRQKKFITAINGYPEIQKCTKYQEFAIKRGRASSNNTILKGYFSTETKGENLYEMQKRLLTAAAKESSASIETDTCIEELNNGLRLRKICIRGSFPH